VKKSLHYILENIFKTLRKEFYQNRPSFVQDVTKHFGLLFFVDTVYNTVPDYAETADDQPHEQTLHWRRHGSDHLMTVRTRRLYCSFSQRNRLLRLN